MTRNALLCASTLPAMLLLTACGDDLESRSQAAERAIAERETAAQDADEQDSDVSEESEAAAPAETTSDADVGEAEEAAEAEEAVLDASPEDLMDTTQGFAPEPLDDAVGIDPAPIDPEPVT